MYFFVKNLLLYYFHYFNNQQIRLKFTVKIGKQVIKYKKIICNLFAFFFKIISYYNLSNY